MSFLKRAIRRGVSDAGGKAIGKALEPTLNDLASKATSSIEQQTNTACKQPQQSFMPKDAMSRIERSMQGYVTEAAKNIKICPGCQKTVSADKKFCPECGERLPEHTIAQGAVCTSCGKQNEIGTRFCQDCGTKLPVAIQEEEMSAKKNAAAMEEWEQEIPQYPKWVCGGDEIHIENYGEGAYGISVVFRNNPQAAQRAVEEYRKILLANGFRTAGQHQSIEQLFKRIDGIVYNADTEHCFEGDPDTACIGFCIREPYGGFDYVKPEPKKSVSIKDLLGL